MKDVFLGIGSNVDHAKNVPAYLKLLKQTFRVKKISSIYETEPVGPAGRENFWNLAVLIETDLQPVDLTREVRKIEKKLGRRRNENKFAPRTIDIDLLPQPGYQQQAFMMIPLAEIAPAGADPETGKTFGELAAALKDKPSVRKIG